jgi:hypothetical protein
MNASEMELCRDIRREYAKHPVDISFLEINCLKGVVNITGQIFPIRSQPNHPLRETTEIVVKKFSRDQRVRQILSTEIRYQSIKSSKEKEAEASPQAGYRHSHRHHGVST